MVDWMTPGKTLGLIGASNWAYEILMMAKKMGFTVGVYSNNQHAPIVKAADWALIGPYDDREALTELAYRSDFISYQTDELSSDMIEQLQKTVSVPQGSELLSIVQDRVLQKAYLEANSINLAPYATIVTISDIEEAVNSIGYPCILKTNRTDRQINDQVILYDESELDKAVPLLEHGVCVLEAMIPFERELVVSAVRNHQGDTIVFPVSESIYRNGDLYQAITPARVATEVVEEVQRIVEMLATELNVAGALSLELFVTATGTLYVNRIISGPHMAGNYSAHYTNMSQLGAHVRGLANWPLAEPVLYNPTMMIPFHEAHREKIIKQMQIKPEWNLHFYPKVQTEQTEKERGFLTIPISDLNQTLEDVSEMGLWE